MSQHHPFLPTPAPCGSCPSLQNKGNLEITWEMAPTWITAPWQDTTRNFWALEKLVRLWKRPSFASSGEGAGSRDPQAAIHPPPFPQGGVRAESLQTRHHAATEWIHCL